MREQWKEKDWYVNIYLKSTHWLEFVKVVRDFYGNKCALCNKPAKDGHHRTYERLGHELLQDVILLCRKCHEKHHSVNHGVAFSPCSEKLRLTSAKTVLDVRGEVEFRADFQDQSGGLWQVTIPLCDTPERSFRENFFYFQNFFKLLGVAPCQETIQTDPTGAKSVVYWFAAMKAVVDAKHNLVPIESRLLEREYGAERL